MPVLVNGKDPHVVLFHDRDKDADVAEMLDIVALDPNGDGHYDDAKVVKSIPVGQSAVAGHAGHHEACVDADGRFLIFTNPGDGSISVYSFKSGTIVATSTVGGKPTSIVAHGGQDGGD
jgi:DNA-binding beta-propeller fold protein YncE